MLLAQIAPSPRARRSRPGRLARSAACFFHFGAASLALVFAVAASSRSALAQSAPPLVTSFSATPATIAAGGVATLHWTTSGATSLSISPEPGAVSGTSATVGPAATTVYTLTATGPGGVATSTAGVAVGESAYVYLDAYADALLGEWRVANWGEPVVNLAAPAPGRSGSAIEVSINADWLGFSLADIGDNWMHLTRHNFSDTKTLEFDVWFAGSADADALEFLLDDTGTHRAISLVDFIPGWTAMSTGERYGRWHHVVVKFADLEPTISSFFRFVLFNNVAGARPHFFLDAVRLGTITDVLPPAIALGALVVDYDQLSLPFTTDEAATYRIDYGYGDYAHSLSGPTAIATRHGAALAGLTRGATLQFRIVATDPAGNQGVLTGSVPVVDPPPPSSATVVVTADLAATRPISPWIYGINFYQGSAAFVRNLTLNRQGGNRWTAYNWENNASNAGNDWFFHNDGYLSASDTPGEAVRPLLAADRARGTASLFTVPILGHVAADKNGDDVTAVTPLSTRLATRFKELVPKKPVATAGAFTLAPSTTDAFVYADEFVWAMDQLIPGDIYADAARPVFISLDNEPDLWNSTHSEITPDLPTPDAYIARTIAFTRAIKDLAPSAKLFGPAHFGFSGLAAWQGSPGFSATYWFADKYLQDLKAASLADGRRLLDVFDFHWYSEAYVGGTRVTGLDSATLTDDQIQGIVQCPRSLWDPTYVENSWIAQWFGEPIRLLPRLQAKIDADWPGTELAITEWNNGGLNHVAGAISVADTLGIYGQHGVFAATYWPLKTPTAADFDLAGFKMYRDYDGALASFGDVSIATTSSDTAKVSAYLSRDSAVPGRHVVVAINRSNLPQALGFAGLPLVAHARLFRLGRAANVPAAVGAADVDLTRWLVSLPAYSITTIELTGAVPADTYAAWRLLHFTGDDLSNDSVSGPDADPDHAGLANFARYAFDLPARGPAAWPAAASVTEPGPGVGKRLAVTFTRRGSGAGLSYIVESSADLAAWATVETLAPGAPASVTVQDTVDLGSGAPRRFLRVRAIASP